MNGWPITFNSVLLIQMKMVLLDCRSEENIDTTSIELCVRKFKVRSDGELCRRWKIDELPVAPPMLPRLFLSSRCAVVCHPIRTYPRLTVITIYNKPGQFYVTSVMSPQEKIIAFACKVTFLDVLMDEKTSFASNIVSTEFESRVGVKVKFHWWFKVTGVDDVTNLIPKVQKHQVRLRCPFFHRRFYREVDRILFALLCILRCLEQVFLTASLHWD